MARCGYCNTFILIGGTKDGDLRFCNAECAARGALKRVADQLPQESVRQFIRSVHEGKCPRCQGPGPVDVHTSYRVWSALVLTSWSSRPAVTCGSCGTKSKLGNLVYCLFLGWWGLPFGVLITPVQIGRNLVALFTGPDPSTPSPKLENILRLHLAAQATSATPAARR